MKALLLDRLGFDDHRMVCWKIDQPALSCILMVVVRSRKEKGFWLLFPPFFGGRGGKQAGH